MGFRSLDALGRLKTVGRTGPIGVTGATGASGAAGKIVQVVNTETGAVAAGTTVIPFDDTIPQNTEGTQFLSLAITPTDVANRLIIDVTVYVSSAQTSQNICAALFQDSTANALAAGYISQASASFENMISIRHFMTAGTVSSTTFKVRVGQDGAGTVTINGFGSTSRRYGGVLASNITITEVLP